MLNILCKIIGFIMGVAFEIMMLIPKLIAKVFIYSFTPKSLRNKKKSSSKPKKKQRYSDKELDKYGLWNDEKELVQADEYDPWDFEENEMLDDYDRYDN